MVMKKKLASWMNRHLPNYSAAYPSWFIWRIVATIWAWAEGCDAAWTWRVYKSD